MLFCPRCDRAFSMEGKQIANFAWAEVDDRFQCILKA
jgi:hypothetical protein